jgi:hypothetical protein
MGAKRLTAAQKVERDRDLFDDRMRGLTWAVISEKYKITPEQGRRIVKEQREALRPKLQDADPFDIVWESVERYEQMYADLADIALDPKAGENARVGAINSQARILAQKDELLQKAGILPQNLGKLRVEHDVRFIVSAIIKVFDEHKVPVEVRRAVLNTLRPASAELN